MLLSLSANLNQHPDYVLLVEGKGSDLIPWHGDTSEDFSLCYLSFLDEIKTYHGPKNDFITMLVSSILNELNLPSIS